MLLRRPLHPLPKKPAQPVEVEQRHAQSARVVDIPLRNLPALIDTGLVLRAAVFSVCAFYDEQVCTITTLRARVYAHLTCPALSL